jgi:hypothetical protein
VLTIRSTYVMFKPLPYADRALSHRRRMITETCSPGRRVKDIDPFWRPDEAVLL